MVDVNKYLTKSFRNPYLKTVAFEIRFPSSLKVLEKFSDFQETVNIEYPNYSEEYPFQANIPDNLLPSKSFRRIRLYNENKTSEIIILHNAITIIENQYIRFKEFQSIVNCIVDKFIGCFPEIKKIIRVGLRYINKNNLGANFEEARLKFKKLYFPLFNTSYFSPESLITFNIEVRKQVAEKIILTFRSSINEEDKQLIHTIDFDAYSAILMDFNEYKEVLPLLRLENKKGFLSVLTDDFMKEMEYYGETEEDGNS